MYAVSTRILRSLEPGKKAPTVGGGVLEVVVIRQKLAGGEVVEDVAEGPGAEDLAVAADGDVERCLGERSVEGEIGGEVSRAGHELLWGGAGGWLAVAEHGGDDDADGAEYRAEHEGHDFLAGGTDGHGDDAAKQPGDGEKCDEIHGGTVGEAALVVQVRSDGFSVTRGRGWGMVRHEEAGVPSSEGEVSSV